MTHLIITDRGLCSVYIERVIDGDADERHGVIFRTLQGKCFILPFDKFSFYVPKSKS